MSAADGFPQACLSLMSDEVMATALAGACWELTLELGSASLCHVSKCSVKQACSISHQVRVISLQATQQRTTIELRQPSTDGITINRSLLFGLLYDKPKCFFFNGRSVLVQTPLNALTFKIHMPYRRPKPQKSYQPQYLGFI